MRRPTVAALFCWVLIFVFFSSPCESFKRRRHRKYHRPECVKLEDAFRKAYFAQVDLIRRGLPTRVVQSEFTWAINYFKYINPSFRFRKDKSKCIQRSIWNKVFDNAYRSRFAIKYLQDIRRITEMITFLSFEMYPAVPKMPQRKQELVQTMWLTCSVQLQKESRKKYKVSDFPFPENVDVLYDPERDQACEQYKKFSIELERKSDVDAKSVLVALTQVSIDLYHRGGNARSVAQMLKHFVGYVFNGIRCLHREGADIKIPKKLVQAYSRNVAMIASTATKGRKGYRILPAAVERVFKEEIHSLLSYNSWGHLQYAILSPTSSLPFKVNVITRIFGSSQLKLLLLLSKSPHLLTPQVSLSTASRHPKDKSNESESEIESESEDFMACDEGYVMMPRLDTVTDPLEACCNEICYTWSDLLSSYLSYSAESCCSRCNELNRCDPEITQEDLSDNNEYSFFVPEYGEQDQIDMFLVAI